MCDYDELFLGVLERHSNHPKWIDADFGAIKLVNNTKVGAVGQDFIEEISRELGLEVEFPLNEKGEKATQSPWDIKIEGVEFELKTASEDVSGSFQFNHIRYHREYDAVICLGVSPNELYFGVWSKSDIATGKAGKLVSMEKQANASYKLTKKPKDLHPIARFEQVIKKFTKNFS